MRGNDRLNFITSIIELHSQEGNDHSSIWEISKVSIECNYLAVKNREELRLSTK